MLHSALIVQPHPCLLSFHATVFFTHSSTNPICIHIISNTSSLDCVHLHYLSRLACCCCLLSIIDHHLCDEYASGCKEMLQGEFCTILTPPSSSFHLSYPSFLPSFSPPSFLLPPSSLPLPSPLLPSFLLLPSCPQPSLSCPSCSKHHQSGP